MARVQKSCGNVGLILLERGESLMGEVFWAFVGLAICILLFLTLGGDEWTLAMWNRWLTHKEEIARIKADISKEE
ncbi:MAG: hypothetical protein CEN92_470 [Candidatus Berkelbacteria bacterium Licking1014_96]|uniref:Uncharacterized protein n=1 Tax=Candidatus Berkelbacteria bacterium Licking1014_96 TaxID=2017149 RepID=A0A554LBS0_9BACT|nr:MAG: hypothetical protein CEN92_470 [Candidatus Berkelbacteria bacterium Licking1014_96]